MNWKKKDFTIKMYSGKSDFDWFFGNLFFQSPNQNLSLCDIENPVQEAAIELGKMDGMLLESSCFKSGVFFKDSAGKLYNSSLIANEIGELEYFNVNSEYRPVSLLKEIHCVLCSSRDYKTPKLALFNDKGAQIWEIDGQGIKGIVANELLLLRSIHNYRNTGIEAREIESGNLAWSVEAENWPFPNFEISGILVSEDYVYITSTKAAAIAALDLSTGQLLQSWHNLPTGTTLGPQQSTVLPNPAHSVLHEEAGKILGLTGYYYWEIDLQTGALQAQDCTSGFKSRRLRAMTPPVCQGDHLYFSSDEVFEKPDGTLGHDIKLAAFNWRTRQIDWEWAFDHPGEGLYQIGMPKVHGDYLAAADTGGQLHLFKKTS
jgi:outer membrane protein assembly factor BamB